jgi:GntR family transcriptional regulator
VRPGALLLTLFQLDSTADGTVVLVSQEHHLADAFEFTVYRRGPGDESDDAK